MTVREPLASVSLDVDNLWSYLKTHGDEGWEARPTYLPTFLPHMLDLLDELDLRITFFVVGVDADRDENAEVLRALIRRGHEVGNHSYEHEPWLHRYDPGRLADEISRAEEAIVRVTGQRPRGFRGPGYSWSPALLRILADRDYLFDSSTLPTYLGPLARAYYFATARLSDDERAERGALFGSIRDGFRPVRPYRWTMDGGPGLLEIPVTTIPVVKTPFHVSYLLYLCRFSEALAEAYLRSALTICRAFRIAPTLLLHPLDLLGGDLVPQLTFFPGMDLRTDRKERLLRRFLSLLRERHVLVPMSAHARALETGPPLRRIEPELSTAGGG